MTSRLNRTINENRRAVNQAILLNLFRRFNLAPGPYRWQIRRKKKNSAAH